MTKKPEGEQPAPRVVVVTITPDCLARLFRGEVEQVESGDLVVQLSLVKQAPSAGWKGEGAYIRMQPKNTT